MTKKIQISINHPKWDPLEANEEIAGLIEYLRKLNINTFRTCQKENPGKVWIEFHSINDIHLFLVYLFYFKGHDLFELNELYNRINDQWVFIAEFFLPEDKQYELTNILEPSISLQIPKADYLLVLNAIKKYWEEIGQYKIKKNND